MRTRIINKKENTSKVGVYVSVILSIVTISYFGYQVYKTVKKINKKEDQEKEDLENLGISSEKMKKEVKPHEKENFVKKLYTATTFTAQPIVDDDMLDTEDALDSSNTIHIYQRNRREVNTGGNFRDVHNKNFLDITFEIPDYLTDLKSNRSSLHISDYIRCINEASDHITSEIIRFTPKPERKLVGWLKLKISYENPNYNPNDDLDAYVEIPKWVYKCYEDGRGRGLTELYKKVTLDDTFGEAEEKLKEFLGEAFPNLKVKVEFMGLSYRIIYPIQDELNPYGITLKTALDTVKYLYDELQIWKESSRPNDFTEYNHILFHAPGKNGNWSMNKFYDVGDENKVILLDINELKKRKEEK